MRTWSGIPKGGQKEELRSDGAPRRSFLKGMFGCRLRPNSTQFEMADDFLWNGKKRNRKEERKCLSNNNLYPSTRHATRPTILYLNERPHHSSFRHQRPAGVRSHLTLPLPLPCLSFPVQIECWQFRNECRTHAWNDATHGTECGEVQ